LHPNKKNTKAKKKHFIFIIQNNNKNRKHIKIKNKKDKSLKIKIKHELNIVEITHLCIRHWVQTSISTNVDNYKHPGWVRHDNLVHPKTKNQNGRLRTR